MQLWFPNFLPCNYGSAIISWHSINYNLSAQQPITGGMDSVGPGGCFTKKSLQNNLANIYNARNHIYGENLKMKQIFSLKFL